MAAALARLLPRLPRRRAPKARIWSPSPGLLRFGVGAATEDVAADGAWQDMAETSAPFLRRALGRKPPAMVRLVFHDGLLALNALTITAVEVRATPSRSQSQKIQAPSEQPLGGDLPLWKVTADTPDHEGARDGSGPGIATSSGRSAKTSSRSPPAASAVPPAAPPAEPAPIARPPIRPSDAAAPEPSPSGKPPIPPAPVPSGNTEREDGGSRSGSGHSHPTQADDAEERHLGNRAKRPNEALGAGEPLPIIDGAPEERVSRPPHTTIAASPTASHAPPTGHDVTPSPAFANRGGGTGDGVAQGSISGASFLQAAWLWLVLAGAFGGLALFAFHAQRSDRLAEQQLREEMAVSELPEKVEDDWVRHAVSSVQRIVSRNGRHFVVRRPNWPFEGGETLVSPIAQGYSVNCGSILMEITLVVGGADVAVLNFDGRSADGVAAPPLIVNISSIAAQKLKRRLCMEVAQAIELIGVR